MADRRLNFDKGTKCEIGFYLRPRFYMKLAESVNGAITRRALRYRSWSYLDFISQFRPSINRVASTFVERSQLAGQLIIRL